MSPLNNPANYKKLSKVLGITLGQDCGLSISAGLASIDLPLQCDSNRARAGRSNLPLLHLCLTVIHSRPITDLSGPLHCHWPRASKGGHGKPSIYLGYVESLPIPAPQSVMLSAAKWHVHLYALIDTSNPTNYFFFHPGLVCIFFLQGIHTKRPHLRLNQSIKQAGLAQVIRQERQ